jgi:hypothetical protein
MKFEIPAPDSRDAEFWSDFVEIILNKEFPLLRPTNEVRAKHITNDLLERLGVFYAKVEGP